MSHHHSIPDDHFLIIIGAMKGGTTSLFDYLAAHPRICGARLKEPEYFSEFDNERMRGQCYEALWEFDRRRHRYVLEASTGYTRSLTFDSAAAMHAYGLRPRLLYLVRDPLRRIESHYNMMTQLPAVDWRHAIDDEDLVDVSRYFSHAERFARRFGRDSLRVFRFEDFTIGQPAMFGELFDFLELEPIPIEEEVPRRNVTADLPSSTRRRLHAVVPRGIRARVPSALKWPVRRLDRALKRDGKARLTEAQGERIRADLAPEMRGLREVYGVDVTSWGFAP